MRGKINSYFIAVVLSNDVGCRVEQIKQTFKERFNCLAALKSPAHITLQPPFSFLESQEIHYLQKIGLFCLTRRPFTVELKNFAAFAPRTIFIDVVANNFLSELQSDLRKFLQNESLINQAQNDKRPFKPHVTVANRDLKPDDFKLAWQDYQKQPFEARFEVKSVSLLKHDGAGWKILGNFPFSSNR